MFSREASQLFAQLALHQCLGMGSFDPGQGRYVCELHLDVLDPQCAVQKPKILGESWEVQGQRKKK